MLKCEIRIDYIIWGLKMRKSIFYIPAIIFAILYGMIAISDIRAISPIVLIWLALFFISGFILNKNIFWGSLLGTLPAIHLIYMGTQEKGQIINEMPIGIVLLIFYTMGGYFVYRNNNKVKITKARQELNKCKQYKHITRGDITQEKGKFL